MNVCHFTGRLTRDPELRSLKGDSRVVKFGIATDRRVKNQDTGEWENQGEFFDFEAWNKQADVINNYFKKGDSIVITAEAAVDRWEKDGQKRSKVYFKVRDFEFGAKSKNRADPEAVGAATGNGDDDQLPF